MRKVLAASQTVCSFLIAVAVMAGFPTLVQGQEEAPAIEPKVKIILDEMSEHVGTLKQFSLHAENTTDVVISAGRKLQYAESVDLYVRRPDRFRAAIKGDLVKQDLYYDGNTITLTNPDLNFYATIEAPPEIEAALDHALESFGIEAPLAEFVHPSSDENLFETVESASYIGLHSVHGVECHHVLLVLEETDAQIWIENSETPVPRKVVITSKMVTGAPQFTALLFDWNVDAKLTDNLFTFVAPEGAEKIEFLPIDAGQ